MLMHGKKHQSGNTSGTDTEDDVSDNELRQTAHDLRHGAKKKELTMNVRIYNILLLVGAHLVLNVSVLRLIKSDPQ